MFSIVSIEKKSDNNYMQIEFPELQAFCAKDCNRYNFIQQYLEKHGLSSIPISVNGKVHIYVKFPNSAYNPQFRIKTIIAHYDRVEGSPGANDNSAAVFYLMNWAVRLQQKWSFHNIRIVFTDGEEIGVGGVKDQGAYTLAQVFKDLNIINNDIYVFDCMGRGEIPVIAKTHLPVSMDRKFLTQFSGLYERAKTILRTACPASWIELPVSYSDNAGFLACGIPAVAITMLPKEEATEYLKNLFLYKDLENIVMNRDSSMDTNKSITPDYIYKEKIPYTWRLLHTTFDNVQSLSSQSFSIFAKILNELAAIQSV